MARRRKKRKLNLRLLAIVLIVLIVFLLGLGRYIKTPQGKAFLLDIGFGGRFSEVQGSIGEAVMRTLHEFDAYAIKEKRVGHPLRKVQIVSIEARVPAGCNGGCRKNGWEGYLRLRNTQGQGA